MFCGVRRRKSDVEIDVDKVTCLGGTHNMKKVQAISSEGLSHHPRQCHREQAFSMDIDTENIPYIPANGNECLYHGGSSRHGVNHRGCSTDSGVHSEQVNYEDFHGVGIHMDIGNENIYDYRDKPMHTKPTQSRRPMGEMPVNVFSGDHHQQRIYKQQPMMEHRHDPQGCHEENCQCVSETYPYRHRGLQQAPAYNRDSGEFMDLSTMDAIGELQRKVPLYQVYKGQLKVAIYMNFGLLTVHVVQGRHLNCQAGPTCDVYVEVGLMPSERGRFPCRTDISHNTRNPSFDEKFSFELSDSDLDKRVVIAAWNKDLVSGDGELLGCMSFGLRNLQARDKSVNGWYILLSEEIGCKKHLQAPDSRRHLAEKPAEAASVKPMRQESQPTLDSHTVILRRKEGGYGFTLGGWNPVKVARVDNGSPADRAGLASGDCIIRVNGVNVSTLTADTIARLIRNSQEYAMIDIQRERDESAPCGYTKRSLSRQGSFTSWNSLSRGLSRQPSKTVLNDVGNRYGSLPRKRQKIQSTIF